MTNLKKENPNEIKLNNYYIGCSFELIKKLPDNSIDLIVTSPPYANATSYGEKINVFHPKNYPDWILPLINEIYRVLKPTGSFIFNINDKVQNGSRDTYVFNLIHRIVEETNLKLYERYIWHKKSGLPTGGDKRLNDKIEYIFHFTKSKNHKAYIDRIRIPYTKSSINRFKTPVWLHDDIDEKGLTKKTKLKKIDLNENGKKPDCVFRFNTAGTLKGYSAGKHPATFHPDLPHFFINWLTDEGDVVLDPFLGTGTVIQVAEKMNRRWIGFELNDYYEEIIKIKMSKEEITKLNFSKIEYLFTNKSGLY